MYEVRFLVPASASSRWVCTQFPRHQQPVTAKLYLDRCPIQSNPIQSLYIDRQTPAGAI